MRLFHASFGAWVIGISAYSLWERRTSGRSHTGEWLGIVTGSALAMCLALPTILLPAMTVLRWKLRGFEPLICFPLAAGLVGTFPITIMLLLIAEELGAQLESNALPYYIMCALMSSLFGLGYAVLRGAPK